VSLVAIGHHPEMTTEILVGIFQRGLGDKYTVFESHALMTDLMVKKSGWTGCGVKLQQHGDRSDFVTRQAYGNPMYAAFMGSLLSLLFLRPGWKRLEEEVVAFIENEPAFR
jgi:hypothetical protein